MGVRALKARRLVLLAPSRGFGGGIERMADAILAAWPGPATRVDLYRADHVTRAEGQIRVKLGFAARALAHCARARPGTLTIVVTHAGLLPVAHVIALPGRHRVVLMAMGVEVWSSMSASERWTIARCDALVAISRFTADWLARRSGVERRRVRVVLPPVPTTVVDEAGDTHEPDPRPTIITVSRLEPEHRYKGHFEVAEAIALARDRMEIRWTVVGTGPDLGALEHHVADLGIADLVRFETDLDDAGLIRAYREAWVHVLPSRADPLEDPPIGEGFGIVYAEAGAHGIPSVASSAGGGALDFVEDGVTGRLCPDRDPAALAEILLDLCRDVANRRAMGATARERVRAHHHPRDYGERLVSAFASEAR